MNTQCQVAIPLIGTDSSSRVALVNAFKKSIPEIQRISLVTIIKTFANDPGIFNLHNQYLAQDLLDKAFESPFMIKESNLRRVLGRMYEMLNDKYAFNPNKVGLNNFRLLVMATPNDLLKYIGFEVMRTAYRDFVPILSYSPYYGRPGVFLIDDVRFSNELELASNRFQLTYPIRILTKEKDKTKADSLYGHLREDLSTYPVFAEVKYTKNTEDLNAAIAEVEKMIATDVAAKMESGAVPQLYMPQAAGNSSTELRPGVMQIGKHMFAKENHIGVRDDEIKV